MGVRDVLSHHYCDLDAEVVYTVCDTHIEELVQTVQRILADLQEE